MNNEISAYSFTLKKIQPKIYNIQNAAGKKDITLILIVCIWIMYLVHSRRGP